ncbi:MAG: hypothetical protein SGI83_13545 [Bacteroidota bacterium]|nr:hypothetical protein [Bacteroidota bacterium]
MKNIILLLSFSALVVTTFAQQQTFDITSFTPSIGWKKKASADAIQFTIEDAAKGTYCIITLFKAVPGTANPKENFDLAWTSVVKEMVTVSTAPEMQPPVTEDGWEAQSGYAPFESEGSKGVVMLVTSTGFEKMVNIMIMTNSDVYEKDITSFLESISFKKITTTAKKTVVNPIKPPVTNVVAKKDGFASTTTNFDDGWNSTVQEDWVEVTKGNIKVLIHYPNKNADAYNSVLLDGLKNAWNILIAPRYSTASNFEFKPVSGWQSIEFGEADAVEKITGKKMHVVLFKYNYSNGSGKYMEFITTDKNSFEKEFGAYHQESSGWEKMEKMANYNKFGVAAADLTGKWTNDFSGLTQYVNANTGAGAGADTHASNQSFEFSTANSYKWDIAMASGFVGSIKFQSRKSAGKFSLPGNWQVNFSDIEGKPKQYNTYFSCIKGARILWLQDKSYGDYTGFGKSK